MLLRILPIAPANDLASRRISGAARLREAPGRVSIVQFIVNNRVYLGAGAIAIMWAMPPWFGAEVAWMAMLPVLLAGFGVYQFNRVFDFVEDQINDPGAYAQAYRSRTALRAMAVAAMVASLLLSMVFLGYAATALLAVMLLAGVLYSAPLLTHRRLKQVAGAKNVIPSLVWPVATLVYPTGVLTLESMLAVGLVACSVFTIEVAWDVRDRRGDRIAGINSFAAILGPTKALVIPLAASLTYALFVALLVALFDRLPAIWLFPGMLPALLAGIALLWKDSLAASRGLSHLLVLINMLALLPLSIAGRWGV
ncbi:UbiA family prenyltransferase [Nonomuraea sp. B12E4]|uniref:UbiA family prenyltransferase n=1 Tax=Nonomuraea sp. B12E4 TaxID=3153564 RepID=UPI00325F3E49